MASFRGSVRRGVRLSVALAGAWLVAACGSDEESSKGTVDAGVTPDATADVQADQDTEAGEPDSGDASEDAIDEVAEDVVADVEPDAPSGGVVLEKYEEACARINGCLGVVGQGECMRRAYLYELAGDDEQRYYFALQSLSYGPGIPPGTIYFPDVVACAEQAGSCDEVFACVGQGDTCNAAGTMPYCESDVLYNCANVGTTQGVLIEADCSAHGLSCLSSPNGAPSICAEGFCDPNVYVANCVGDVAYNCVGAGLVAKDCALLFPGTSCGVADESGVTVAQCRGDGEPCDATLKPACVGDDVKVCQDGFEYTRVCPPGLPCGVDPSTNAASCGATVTAGCTPETCDGSELTYCLDGEPRVLDCTQYGFGGCVQDDVFDQARCAL